MLSNGLPGNGSNIPQSKEVQPMTEAKIEIGIGQIHFTGEGSEEWGAQQLDKILSKAKDLLQLVPPALVQDAVKTHKEIASDKIVAQKPLATFFKEKNATNQVKRFLATAIWLESRGKNRLTTTEVGDALRKNSQTPLTNPSDCLGQNVGKGFCAKDGKTFYVTEEGKAALKP
jgi:hypothetical protein